MSKDWVDYQVAYSTPENYKPPLTYNDAAVSTHYPNFNSFQSRLLPVSRERVCLPSYDILLHDSNDVFTVVTNDYVGRLWYGTIVAFRTFEDLAARRDDAYLIEATSTITGAKLVDTNMLLFSEIDGSLSLYSLQCDRRPSDSSGYAVFRIGCKNEDHDAINALDIFRANPCRAITGWKNGTLKIFDLACGALQSTMTRRNAHMHNITGVSTSPTSADLYVTSSEDRCIMTWDERDPRPALAIFDNHIVNFSSVYWTTEEENKGLVVVGDSAGWVRIFDIRQPGVVLGSTRLNKNIVHGFHFKK